MTAKLTNELRDEITSNPCQAVPIVDDQNNKVYYLVDEAFLMGVGEYDEPFRAKLQALIQEGFAGEELSAEEGEARIRRKMQSISSKIA